LLIKVGHFIGVFNTIAIVIGTGIAGALLARREGLKTIYGIQRELEVGIVPSDRLIDGVFIFCGGLMLLTPGFITDLVGFAFLMPYTRNLLKAWLVDKFKTMIEKEKITSFDSF
ncbi:MAG: FxsA family protein, partial [Candidatus Omnitrophota bacterium]